MKNQDKSNQFSDTTPTEPNEVHPLKRLALFQLKLVFDALRDILLSPISIIATIIDLIENRRGQKSYFSLLLKYGRESERRINLFEQHSSKRQAKTVDTVVQKVEDIIVKEYKNGEISSKALKAIEKTLQIKKSDNSKPKD